MQKPLFAFLLHLLVRLSAATSLNQCTISHLTLAHQWESLLRAIYNHPGINREHHGLLPNMKFYGRHSGVCITYFKMRAVLHNVGYRTSHLQSTTSSLMYSSQAKNSFLPLLCRSPAHSLLASMQSIRKPRSTNPSWPWVFQTTRRESPFAGIPLIKLRILYNRRWAVHLQSALA